MRESWSLHTVKQDMYQPTLIHFAAWLKDKAEAHERMKSTTFPKSRVEDAVKSKTSSKVFAGASQGSKPVPSSSSSTTNFDPCIVCKGKHPLWKCAVFKEKTPTQRAKVVADSKMCFSCINGKHPAKDCPKKMKCSHPGCGKSHNVLLHGAERVYPQAQKPKPKSDSTSAAPAATKAPVTSTGVTGVTDVKGLLQIAAVTISSKGKTESVLALCDGGCTHSWISEDLSNNLGLTGTPVQLTLSGINSESLISTTKVNVSVSSNTDDPPFSFDVSPYVKGSIDVGKDVINVPNLQAQFPHLAPSLL